ncbi:MAG TPA: C2 family cysteine protease, partial [Myxococcota bacterium]
AVIEVNNLTRLPTGSGVTVDGVEVARAGSDGRFFAKLTGATPGDVLQVQLRAPGQPITTALQLRVDAARTQFDPTAPMVRTDRLRVVADGSTATISTRTRQPVTEPDATVRIENARTKQFVDVIADVFGRLPDVSIAAVFGDKLTIKASDGSTDIAGAHAIDRFDVVDRAAPSQPAPLLKDASYVKLLPLTGPLFLDNGPGYGRQGSIGNCPVPAACVALAAVDVDTLKKLIVDNGNGTCTVTFHPQGQRPVEIVVDNQVWGSGSSPRYGHAERTGGGMERWFPLVEKAYAAWVGDYEVLGKGTSVGKVLGELTGRPVREVWTNEHSVDEVWAKASRAASDGLPMAAGTFGTSESARYRGTGVYANHAYSVLGVEEKAGQRLITLRNPWGSGAANSGRVGAYDTGVFQMKVEDFCQLYQVLNIS